MAVAAANAFRLWFMRERCNSENEQRGRGHSLAFVTPCTFAV